MTWVCNDLFELAKKIAVIGAFSLAQTQTKHGSESWALLGIAIFALKFILIGWATTHMVAQYYPRVRRLLERIKLGRRWHRILAFAAAIGLCGVAFWQFDKGFERIINGITAGLAAPAK